MHASSRPCDEARESISLALDGDLVEVESARLATHLECCDECRAFEADVRAVARELRSAELVQPAYQVVLPRARRLSVRWIQAGTAAAAVLTIFACSSLFQSLGQQSATPPRLGLSQSALFRAGDDVAPIRHPTKQTPPKRRVAV